VRDISFWRREGITSECDFRIIERKCELLGFILIKTRNAGLLSLIKHGSRDRISSTKKRRDVSLKLFFIGSFPVTRVEIVDPST